jgi:hypothetical protein
MTDHDAQPRSYTPTPPPRISLLNAQDELGLLAAQYPQFRFRRENIGWRGPGWIAERLNGLDPGLHTAITSDIEELRAALLHGAARHQETAR